MWKHTGELIMRKRGAWTVVNVMSLVVGIITLVFLISAGSELYANYVNQDSENAKNSMNVLKAKLDAYACYKKELRPGFHPRSLDSLVTLAKFRGNSVGHEYAEAFMVIRHISND